MRLPSLFLNISSGTDVRQGTGDYIHNFTSAFSTAVDEGQRPGVGVTCSGGARGAKSLAVMYIDSNSAFKQRILVMVPTQTVMHSFVICGELA